MLHRGQKSDLKYINFLHFLVKLLGFEYCQAFGIWEKYSQQLLVKLGGHLEHGYVVHIPIRFRDSPQKYGYYAGGFTTCASV
jgi:hypothetical protein